MSAADAGRPTPPPSRGELLVGRDAELEKLQELLEEAKEGRGHLVFVTGEPGTGKTALANEFFRRARPDAGLTVARGRCVEHYGAGEAYLPILDVVGSLLAGPGRASALDLLRTYAPSWCLQLPAAALSPELAETLKQQTVGVTRERMLREVVDFVTAAATQTFPIALLLEDLQWADPSSIEAVRAIANRMVRLRILIVATFRSSEAALFAHPVRACQMELASQAHVHEMDLGLLTREDVRRYVDLRFAPHSFPPEFPQRVHERTEGHPLFLTNLLDFLCTRKDVEVTAGRWALRRPVGESVREMPDRLQEVIRHQVGSLPKEDRRALECAAVIGRDFQSNVLARLLDEDVIQMEERLQRLARVNRMVERKGQEDLPDGSLAVVYRFVHSLYQEVLYRDLVTSRAQQLHLRAGEVLLACYQDQAPRIATALANHFERGRDFAKALAYRVHAGDNAARLFAYAEALENYDQGLLLVEKLPEKDRPPRLLALHQKTGAAQLACGRFDRAVVDFTLMRQRARNAEDLEQEAAALAGLCNALFFAGRIEEMAVRAHEALGLAAQGGGEPLRVQALVHVAQVLEADGRLSETIPLLDDTIAAARKGGYEPALAAALAYRGLGFFWKREFHPSEALFADGADVAARVGDGFLSLACRMFRDVCRARLGRISEGLAGLEETTEVARRNGDRFWLPRLLAQVGWIRSELQVFEGAIARNEEALRIGREAQLAGAPEAEALLNLCVYYARAGRSAESEQMIEELQAIGSPTRRTWSRWFHQLRLHHVVAEHWLLLGDVSAAAREAKRLVEFAQGLDESLFPASSRRLLGEIALVEGRAAEAAAQASAVLDGLLERPAPLEAWRASSLLARARLAMGDAAGARAAFREAQEVVSALAASIQDDELRAGFLDSPAAREIAAGASPPG
jgi:tetratricopeptide (TPR) repeat protein